MRACVCMGESVNGCLTGSASSVISSVLCQFQWASIENNGGSWPTAHQEKKLLHSCFMILRLQEILNRNTATTKVV